MQNTDPYIEGAANDAIARAVAIGGLVSIALIHMLQLPSAFAGIGYLGALFIVAIAVSLLVAAALTRTSDDRAWAAAGGLAALILLGYVISRSVGLPGFTDDMGEWSERPGLASMVVESLVIFVTTAVLATRHQPMRRAAGPVPARGTGMQPGAAGG